MPKINFTKAEVALHRALQKLQIDKLTELANIADGMQETTEHVMTKPMEETIVRFQKELAKLKNEDANLHQKLNFSEAEEKRLMAPAPEFTLEDWALVKALKQKIDAVKQELYGEDVLSRENTQQIAKERRKHINKRFNVRDTWLPLH